VATLIAGALFLAALSILVFMLYKFVTRNKVSAEDVRNRISARQLDLMDRMQTSNSKMEERFAAATEKLQEALKDQANLVRESVEKSVAQSEAVLKLLTENAEKLEAGYAGFIAGVTGQADALRSGLREGLESVQRAMQTSMDTLVPRLVENTVRIADAEHKKTRDELAAHIKHILERLGDGPDGVVEKLAQKCAELLSALSAWRTEHVETNKDLQRQIKAISDGLERLTARLLALPGPEGGNKDAEKQTSPGPTGA
jgi:hypothetical protein